MADGPGTKDEWAAYDKRPEWLVTVRMVRDARFAVHADSPEDAESAVRNSVNGVRALEDLYDGDITVDHVISVERTD